MLHSRTLNNTINRLHKRALRIVYSDYKSSFNTLLEKDGSFPTHHRNIQSPAIEIYKFLQASLQLLWATFKTQLASYIQPKNSPGII